MLGKEHLQFAIITGTATFTGLYQSIEITKAPVIFFTSLALGSLLPDIDLQYSSMGLEFRGMSKMISKHFPHRTFTHDVLLWSIISIISSIKFPFLVPFWIGYMGHLLLDAFTVKGICWGYFLHKKKLNSWFKGHTEEPVSFINGGFRLIPSKIGFVTGNTSTKLFIFIFGFVSAYLICLFGYKHGINIAL